MEDKKLSLNPNEMAFRKMYQALLEQEKITTVFRPGQRLCGDFRGYCAGQKIELRVIEKVGADWAGIAPQFITGFSKGAIIKEIETKTIGELTEKDFEGSSPDISNTDSLKHNLGLIYNLSNEELTNDSVITRIIFEYQ
jgi:hypothetical protein